MSNWATPEKKRAYERSYAKRRSKADPRWRLRRGALNRARALGLPFDIELSGIIVPNFCPVLGIELRQNDGRQCDSSPSLDRIDPTKGYVRGNIQVISMRANRMKNDATLDELKKLVAHLEKVGGY